jgi:hypothetical protein
LIGRAIGVLKQADGLDDRGGHALSGGDLGEFGEIQTAQRIAHDSAQQAVGDKLDFRCAVEREAKKGDNAARREHDAIAGKLVLEVTDQGRGGHYDAQIDFARSRAPRFFEFAKDERGLAGAGRAAN